MKKLLTTLSILLIATASYAQTTTDSVKQGGITYEQHLMLDSIPAPPTQKSSVITKVERVIDGDTIPDTVKALVPMFLNWALKNTSLPGQPEGQDFHYPDSKWLKSTLQSESAEYVYISWNARGDEGAERFQWKYGLLSGRVHPLTVEDRAVIVSRWTDGTLTVAEQAYFRISNLKDIALTVSFSIGLAGGEFPMQRERGHFVISGKPVIRIH